MRICPCSGLLLAYTLGISPQVYLLSHRQEVLFLGAGLLFCLYRRSLLLMCLLLAGYIWGGLCMQAPWQTYRNHLRRRECRATFSCQISSIPNETRRGQSAVLSIKAIETSSGWMPCRGRLLGLFPAECSIRYGEKFQLDGAVLDFESESLYSTYNRIAGTRQRFIVFEILEHHPPKGWARIWGRFLGWRHRLETLLTSGIENKTCAAIYAAMMLGMRNKLDESTRETFVRSASVHIFSISGLHVTMLCACILFFTRCLGIPLRHRAWLALPMVLGYVLLSGGAPSALRAYYMAIGAFLAFFRQRRHCNENSLALSGLILLLANPLYLLHSGFLFSFIMVATLLRGTELTSGIMETLFERRRWLPVGSFQRHWLNRLRIFCAIFGCSTFAWYGSCGLMMHYNQMLSFGSLLVNALLAPFATLLIFAFLPKILFGFIWPSLSVYLGRCLSPVLNGLIVCCQLGALEGICHPCPKLEAMPTLCYYLLFFFALSELRPKWLRITAFLILNMMIISNGFTPSHPPELLAVNGNKSRPPCVAYLPAHGNGALILQVGDRTALRRMLDELKKRGYAQKLTLVLGDIYSADWRRELNTASIVEMVGNPKYLNHRRNRAFIQALRAHGTHIQICDEKPLRIGLLDLQVVDRRITLLTQDGEITLENSEEGTTRISLPNGTTHLRQQSLKSEMVRYPL